MGFFLTIVIISFFVRIECAVQSVFSSDEPNRQTQGVGLGIPPLFINPPKTEDQHSVRPWNQNILGNIEPTIPTIFEKNPCSTMAFNEGQKPVIPIKGRPNEQHLPLNGGCLRARGAFPTSICNKYINCWDGFAQEQTCPENLLFNIAGFCDYPSNVNCQGRILQDFPKVTTPSNDNNIINNILPNFILAYPSTDSPKENNNNYQSNALNLHGAVSNKENTSELYGQNNNLQLKCFQPRGQFPSEQCHKYINCWDGIVTEEECPKGLLFSLKGFCDYPSNVNCGSRTFPNIPYQSTECPGLNGAFRDRMNCRKYIICSLNAVIARYECPEGLYFNEAIGVCDYPVNVRCEIKF
ncbi:probable chitinase 10 isoform X2 [Agrilus planipennis]|uniref:Probable chitinase 10 isoform X2 n=1 Tax=Agrilus planipennis TaxID=224129 RepID=A0A7F5R4J8_AGRPL|nr:probable chitinase 10 isoform X2 [Agrilus planipennis]